MFKERAESRDWVILGVVDSSAEVRNWRKAKRVELLKARLELAPEAYRQLSRRVLECLIDNFREHCSGAVGLYFPFRGEINLMPFVEQVRTWGGSTSLPVVVAKGQPLEFREWKRGEALQKGVLGIPFPAYGARVLPQTLVIPLVGFDAACFRLGYGAGYYDYTLQAAPRRPVTIGVGFELARLDTVYPQPHDVPMDFIVTERGLQRKP
jgi:5,10-methenyltetrahydrofolate synthetase